MTVPLPSSLPRIGLSAHSHTPTQPRFTAQFDGGVPCPHSPVLRPVWRHIPPPVMTESPFAPSRRYLLGRRVFPRLRPALPGPHRHYGLMRQT